MPVRCAAPLILQGYQARYGVNIGDDTAYRR